MLTAAATAQDWKDRLEVFDSVRILQAPEGYLVQSSPGGHVVKDVSKAEPVNVKAALEQDGKRYYMSDWSWSRYEAGREPYWILLRGKESAEPSTPTQTGTDAATPAPAGEAPVQVAKTRPPTLEEQLEMKWEGELEVYSATRDIPAPKGYKLLATPDREEKALRTNSSKSSFTAQAALTRKDGYVYYISDWSWSRAKAGKDPSWMHLIGAKPQAESERVAQAGPEEETEPVNVASITPNPASLVETVVQMVRPKLTLDSVEASGRVVALLIGNSRYSSANRAQQMLDLEDPALDVELLGRTLRPLNVEVREERDLNLEQLTKVVQETADGLRPGDVFLFYYAGHALQLAGKNFLVPLGINFLDKKTVRESAYSLELLWKAVSNRSLRFAAVCLDGCRKNPFNAKDSTFYILSRIPGLNLAPDGGSKPGLASEKPPRNAMLSFAAEPGSVMPELPAGGHPSPYALALAAACAENVEIRQAMNSVNRRVSEATGRQQLPWTAGGDFPQFYLHTPGRSSLDPDQAVARAAEWLSREKDKGLPIALGLLARSVRERPEKNPATAGLLFLLGYQAMPVPVKSWGPFPAPEGEVASDMQLSIDGRFLAICAPKEGKPVLVLDRERGEVVSEAEETFAQGLGKVAIVREGLGLPRAQGAGELAVISFQRKPEADAAAAGEAVQAMTPLLAKSRMVASFYDEGLERVFLALVDDAKKVTFCEYSTTPPVGCREEFRIASPMPDLTKTGSAPLGAGAVPDGPEGPAHAWSLVFDAASDQIRFLRGGESVYHRDGATKPERRIDDWRADLPARKLVLVYRDHVDVLGLNGAVAARFDLPAASSSPRKILACNAAFRRLVLAWGAADPAAEGRQQISVFDLSNGQRIGETESLVGYSEFAGMSADQEWFVYYDSSRRLRLVDMLSGGTRFHLPGTATLQPLPVGAGLEPGGDAEPAFPSLELHQPPWLSGLGTASRAPNWLPDLAEALIGFQVNENSEVEWLDNGPKRVESAVQQMRKRPGDDSQKAWAQWILANRLGIEDF